MVLRKPTADELRLIRFLIASSEDRSLATNLLPITMVSEMDDGGMGGLLIFENGVIDRKRKYGSVLASCKFTDADGIEVIASLYLDDNGNIYELDVWKTNFQELISIPNESEFVVCS